MNRSFPLMVAIGILLVSCISRVCFYSPQDFHPDILEMLDDGKSFTQLSKTSKTTRRNVQDLLDRQDLESVNERLIQYSNRGWVVGVKKLLKHAQINPAFNESKALGLASTKGHDQVVQLLLEDGRADPTARDNDAIILASRNRHMKL
jgi:hypothetical protein